MHTRLSTIQYNDHKVATHNVSFRLILLLFDDLLQLILVPLIHCIYINCAYWCSVQEFFFFWGGGEGKDFSMPPRHTASPCSRSSCSLASTYMLLFSAFPSRLRSWENLHLSPFVQRPCLKKRQRTDLGSAPAETFCVWTGLKRASIAAFSFSRSTFSFYRNQTTTKLVYQHQSNNSLR